MVVFDEDQELVRWFTEIYVKSLIMFLNLSIFRKVPRDPSFLRVWNQLFSNFKLANAATDNLPSTTDYEFQEDKSDDSTAMQYPG